MKQRIPFVGPSHAGRSTDADCQRTLNCYLEMDDATPRAPVALYGRPGLELRGTIGNGPIRAMIEAKQGIGIVVSGNEVYKLTYSGVFGYQATSIGPITTYYDDVGIASNGSQVLIVDGSGGWIVDLSAYTLTTIVDADFPNGVKRAAYQDGYFIVTGDSSQKFYINETLYDGSAWNGLDFASAEGSPDNTIGVISAHRELWLFGDTSAEIWSNTGNADFPFERSGNAFIEVGCASADTVAKLDNTIFWLGKDDRGGLLVWKANGYTPVRISNHAVEKAIQGYTTSFDARAFTYQQEGHSFYVLSFPTASKTWAYDVSTNQWFEWSSRDTLFLYDLRWRASCHMVFGIDHLVGDYENGKFYRLNLDYFLDDGNPIKRLRVSQSAENVQDRMFYASLQVDMETGVGGTLSLRYSNDGGHTWSAIRTASLGSANNTRAIWRRLGCGRNRVWEISTTDNVKFAVIGAVADLQVGMS